MKRAVGALVLAFTLPAGQAEAAQSCTQTMQEIKESAGEIKETAEKSNKDGLVFLIVHPVVDMAANASDEMISEFCGQPENALLLTYVQPYLNKAKDALKDKVILTP